MRSKPTRRPDRGEIWIADLNPRQGTEPGKRRPVLIFQARALLEVGHPSTLVIPMTTNLIADAEPLRIRIPAKERLKRDSDLLIDQLRAIDNRRLSRGPVAHLSADLMSKVGGAIQDVLGLR